MGLSGGVVQGAAGQVHSQAIDRGCCLKKVGYFPAMTAASGDCSSSGAASGAGD